MSVATALRPHPLAELIPVMSDADYGALKESIRANGQKEPITLYEDQVLDGRHRARACDELGLEPITREFDSDDDPVQYVIALNLSRRHLTTGQRAHAALALLDYEKAQAHDRQGHRSDLEPSAEFSQKSEPPNKRATAEVGKKFGVSRDSVEKARALEAKRPDLSDAVKRGEITLNAAIEKDRGYGTNGRPTASEPRPPVSLNSPRDRQRAEKARLRIEKAVGTCNGLARGLDGLKPAEATAVATAEDIAGWDGAFSDATAAIRRLRHRLKENS